MSNRFVIEDIQAALVGRSLPTIMLWNRLEGRPRKEDFDRALRAEVRDPLWMLAKQWQMGEFEGDDAGSPVFAKLHLATSRLNKYQPATHGVQPFDNDVPLEGTVEKRPIPLSMDDKVFSLDLRLMLGRHWLKLLRERVGEGFAGFYVQMARLYFAQPQARAASRVWYTGLLADARSGDADAAEQGTRQAMQESIKLWQALS